LANLTPESNAGHSGAFLGEFDQPSSAFRPASVIITRANWIFRLPTLMVWRCAVASPPWTRSDVEKAIEGYEKLYGRLAPHMVRYIGYLLKWFF
jgi:hypothetical protein